MKKSISFLISLVLLCVLAVSVWAAPSTDPAELNKVNEAAVQMTTDKIFPTSGEAVTADCPACGEKNATWQMLSANTNAGKARGISGHWYLSGNRTGNTGYYVASGGNACLHLNGHTIKSTNAYAIAGGAGLEFNIMGNGSVEGAGSNAYGTVFGQGTVRLFGGTYTATNSNGFVITTAAENANIYVLDGATITGNADATSAIAVTKAANFYLYGGNISGGKNVLYLTTGNTYLAGATIDASNSTLGIYMPSGTANVYHSAGTVSGASGGNSCNVDVRAGNYILSGTGSITGGTTTKEYNSGNVIVTGTGVFTMTGGQITGGSSVKGGNVHVYQSSFIMEGGTISGGTASTAGGNVYIYQGSFTQSGGAITGGEAPNGGGVYNYNGTLTLNGGTISGGEATTSGGSVYVNTGAVTVNSGLITGGTAPLGGNVYLYAGTLTLDGGTITKGTANKVGSASEWYYRGGGNIFVNNSAAAKAIINSGTVSDGNATSSGGNILCRNAGTLTISGGTISGGKSGYPGGNIMTAASTKSTISGGTITGGMGDTDDHYTEDGDNIVAFGGTLTVSGGTVQSAGNCLGDGILVYYTAKLVLDGNASVTNTEKRGNIYIANRAGSASLQVNSTFTGVAGVAFHGEHEVAYGATLPLDSSTGAYTGTVYAEELECAGIYGTADNTLVVAGTRVGTTWYQNNETAMAAVTGDATITLCTSDDLVLKGASYVVDLNGQNVKITGTGSVTCIDSANDTYEIFGSATLDGPSLANDAAVIVDGKTYYKLEEEGVYSFHRVTYQLTAVTLRPSNGGIYYTGIWGADDVLKNHIDQFGVAVDLNKAPGSDFDEQDSSLATCFSNSEFVSGEAHNGVLITNIIRDDADAERIAQNAKYGKKKIYATAYITVDGVNYAGTSLSYSLYDVLRLISANIKDYSAYSESMLAFMDKWDDFGLTPENGYDFVFSVAESIKKLNALYAGLTPYYGELHDHANTGGTSDGKYTLSQWKEGLEYLDMDFATIVDHKQSLHMYLEDWDPATFLGGSEASTTITDRTGVTTHYNMIFADPAGLEKVVNSIPEFKAQVYADDYSGTNADKLAGGWHFSYPNFTRERFMEVVKAVRDAGGFVVIAHPKGSSLYITSDDPMDAYYGDFTGIEVMYTYYTNKNGAKTAANYKLWTDMLAAGYKVYATAGNDEHSAPSDKAVSVIYAAEKNAQAYLNQLRNGNFVAGGIGIKMAIGDTMMGGVCDFAGKEVAFSVGDFHSTHLIDGHEYEILLIDDQGTVESWTITSQEAAKTQYFTHAAEETAKFYRVEIFDKTTGVRIVIGNPIWNQ